MIVDNAATAIIILTEIEECPDFIALTDTFAAAAVGERVALVADGAGAHGPVSAHAALGVDAAG